MVVLCFEIKGLKEISVQTTVFYFVGTVLGGIMSLLYSFLNHLMSEYIKENTYENAYHGARICVIIGLTGILSIVFSKILTEKKNVQNVELKIIIQEKEFNLTGFCDSGNLLIEPFSGKRVILVSKDSEIGEMIEKTKTSKIKYIPYKDINGDGVLYGVDPEEVIINNCSKKAVVAVSKNKSFNGCEALVPVALI